MKILYVVNARIPTEKAHGTQIVNMCEAFASLENEVDLIIPERNNSIQEDAFSFYKVERNFRVKTIWGFDFFSIEKYIGTLAFYLQTLSFLWSLLFLNVSRNAVIYTRNPEVAWIFTMRGYKVVYECHDWFKKNRKIALYFLKNVGHIVALNSYIRNEFLKYGFKEKVVLIAPNGVRLETFDLDISKQVAIDKIKIDESTKSMMREKKVLLYTGSFKTMGVEKGISDIFDAVKKMQRDDLLFVSVGGSEKDIEYYVKLAEEKGIFSQVRIVGRREQSELALFQKASDILLMPFPKLAHYEYHMTPLKMFEYQVSKRPIIASNLPSIKEILNDKNCLFCEPGKPLDLADKIEYLLEHKVLGYALAEQAYRDVQQYSWQARAKKIISNIS